MFLDIALGIMSAVFVGWIFDFNPNWWFFVCGVLITVLPDSDFLFHFLKRKGDKDRIDDYKHRDLIHYPLAYLSLGTLIFYFLFGKEWALLFFLGSFLHFIHDSVGIGWGIKWLWPFSTQNYAFLYLYSRRLKGGLKKLVFSFSKSDLSYYVKEHGDDDWVKNIYYKWHPIAVIEFSVLIILILLLIIY